MLVRKCSNQNKLLLFATWKSLRSLLLSEKNTVIKHCMLYDYIYIYIPEKATVTTENRAVVARCHAWKGYDYL